MTAKEKAIELTEKFWHLDEECELENGFEFGKKCALITIDEIINDKRKILSITGVNANIIFWENVRDELNAL